VPTSSIEEGTAPRFVRPLKRKESDHEFRKREFS
jgi:hypothetical protein